MITQNDMHIFSYKDESPTNTVNKIKDILKKYNVETTETWYETNVPNCHIVVISANGTSFMTTGKGLTKELALASGYGEFMERFQLGFIGRKDVQKDGNYSYNDVQSELIPANQLLQQNPKWYSAFSDRLYIYTGKRYSPDELVMQYADQDKNVICTPYYCITADSKAYLPVALRKAVYTASGCASGNTPEEAIVHAISEIMERYSLVRISAEKITPPDIPEHVLKQFHYAYSIITYLRQHDYKVVVKDCSLGNKYPVISICIINKKNGRYHTHYGADPVLEIAIERALVEPFQGRNIHDVTKHIDFASRPDSRLDVKNLQTEIVWGAAEKPYFFFTGEPTFQYNENMGLSGSNNRELFNECIKYFKDMGYDVLVRDGSCLSFPTYQVVIPGYSEVACHRLDPDYQESKDLPKVANILKDLSAASFDDMLLVAQYIGKTSESFSKLTGLHLNIDNSEDNYLKYSSIAYLDYSLMQFSTAAHIIDILLNFSKKEHEDYLICLKRYLTLIDQGCAPAAIKDILLYFHQPQTVEKLYFYIDSSKNPFDDFILHCDMNCTENCLVYNHCCKEYVSNLVNLINQKTKLLDFDKFADKIRSLVN